MKLIIFSDIHGNSYALKTFLNEIAALEYDYLVFCGDIFGYYYNQSEILDLLFRQPKTILLKGNHDEYFLRAYENSSLEANYIHHYGHSYERLSDRFTDKEVKLIKDLPPFHTLSLPGQKIGIFHGTPDDNLEGRLYPDNEVANAASYQEYDIVILGHTHCRMKRDIGSTLVLNPGSLGQPRDGKGYSYAILDTESKELDFCKIYFDERALYHQIDQHDPDLKKLKEVLERRS